MYSQKSAYFECFINHLKVYFHAKKYQEDNKISNNRSGELRFNKLIKNGIPIYRIVQLVKNLPQRFANWKRTL